MKIETVIKTTAAAAAAVLLGAAVPSGDDDRLVIVESNDFTITLDQFESIAKTQSPLLQKALLSDPAQRQSFLDKLINMNLLSSEAQKRGFDKNPEVLAIKKNRLASLMRQDIKDKFVEKSLTDKEIEKYYQDNEEMFNKPEKMRARHLLISSREKAQELLDRLKKEKINQYRFKQIVIENSEDKDTVDKGGNLMFFTIEGKRRKSLKPVNKKLAEAAFAISENGKLFPELVKTDDGYHIIMRTGHRAATNTSLEDSRERITRLMLRESRQKQMADALEALTKKYNVTLYEENLKHVVIDLSGDPVHKTDSSKRKRRRLNKR